MTMHMATVNVRSNDRLRIVAKVLADKSLGYFVCKLRSDILLIGKTHDIMDSLNCGFPRKGQRAVKVISCKLIVNCLHLQVSVTGICGAVDRGGINHILGLVGI